MSVTYPDIVEESFQEEYSYFHSDVGRGMIAILYFYPLEGVAEKMVGLFGGLCFFCC
jgi:hypothetical protein